MKKIIEKLAACSDADFDELLYLLKNFDDDTRETLAKEAQNVSKQKFGNKIYVRGLIEFTSYCKNDCYYCGIRRSNKNAQRYRLSKDDILSCCENGYSLGFRTFVLQGGDDGYYTDELIADIVRSIKEKYPDCAVTLSIGEKSEKSYKLFFKAGANRYLLRHETANGAHYVKLHPDNMDLGSRINCLAYLKKIGYQTGCGFMVGSPYQTLENIVQDLRFIKNFKPHMIGIGPFIPHKDTPFANFKQGSLELTLTLISILRLMNRNALIPSTTALGTIHPMGREMGILAGANVVMPNLSPVSVRKKYMLYDNKICTGEEAAECKYCLSNRMKTIGYEIVTDRGDYSEI
ncbi:MAG: [FeFe] hydrogenase H-cluster radical SAM maturase HydE [Acutalibacteraceae bacterium]